MYLFFNNKIYNSTEALQLTQSKAFRYGELVFETIRFSNNTLHYFELHFERLYQAAQLLHIHFPKYFNEAILQLHIENVLKKNNLTAARVRVTLFKGNGGLFEIEEDVFNILIECYTLPSVHYELNSNGLDLCFYTNMLKTMDHYSNFKTGNFLIYAMAAHYAKQQKCNDAIVANIQNNICDTSICNLFIVKDENIYTPPITQGCIDGIMRKIILEKNKNIQLKALSKEDILQADEVFLSNVIKGIQWVKQIEDKKYKQNIAANIFSHTFLK